MFTVSSPLLTTLIGVVIPIVTGIVTKYTLPAGAKAIIMLFLNAVAGFLVTATTADGVAVFSRQTFFTAALSFVVAVASYAGLYRPLNVTSSTPNGALLPTMGIGPAVNRTV